MLASQVYFWNEESNEVAWDPPAGSEPRESGENEAVFAAAQASSAPQDSIQGQGSAPEPKHSRPVSAEQAAELDPARLSGPEAALDESMADTEDRELPAQSSLPKQPVDIPMPDEAIGEVHLASKRTHCPGSLSALSSTLLLFLAQDLALEHGQIMPLLERGRRCTLQMKASCSPSAYEGRHRVKSGGRQHISRDTTSLTLVFHPQAAEELLARSWAAAEQLCGRAPLLVRLAVEAEVRTRDWRALAARQRQAAKSQDAAASLSWDAFQHAARADWERLQGALPGALREAEAASAQAAAAVAAARQPRGASPEDGEVPQQKVSILALFMRLLLQLC